METNGQGESRLDRITMRMESSVASIVCCWPRKIVLTEKLDKLTDLQGRLDPAMLETTEKVKRAHQYGDGVIGPEQLTRTD